MTSFQLRHNMILYESHNLESYFTIIIILLLELLERLLIGSHKLVSAPRRHTSEKIMEEKKAYFKVFTYFLSLPRYNERSKEKVPLPRQSSFEYMELSWKLQHPELQEKETSEQSTLSKLDNKKNSEHFLLKSDNNDNSNEYLARPNACKKENSLLPHKNFLKTLAEKEETPKKEASLNDTLSLSVSNGESDFFKELSVALSSSDDDWTTELIEGSKSLQKSRSNNWLPNHLGDTLACLNDDTRVENETSLTDFDRSQFTPTLASIDEADEDYPLEGAKDIQENEDTVFGSDHLSSHSPEHPLRRSNTFDDLSMDASEDNHENLSSFMDENLPSEDYDLDEPELSLLDVPAEPQNPVFDVSSPSHLSNTDTVTQQSSLENIIDSHIDITISVFDDAQEENCDTVKPRSPILRCESPPVVVVESLEEYIKTVIPEQVYRTMPRTKRSSRNRSYRSSLTDSAYSSREGLNGLCQSNPDITLDSCDDDIELQYIPISYADVRVRKKKKNWIKRSSTDVHDKYYFSGEPQGNKLNTLRKKVVRKMSKRYRKHSEEKTLDDASEQSPKPIRKLKEKSSLKPSRVASFRNTVRGVFRRIRDTTHRNKDNKLNSRTRSLPTQLDSCSSMDYYVTESESTSEA